MESGDLDAWIELAYFSSDAVDPLGWKLWDDLRQRCKWVFAGGYRQAHTRRWCRSRTENRTKGSN
jgi:hypothetical protein